MWLWQVVLQEAPEIIKEAKVRMMVDPCIIYISVKDLCAKLQFVNFGRKHSHGYIDPNGQP